jgi:hypothetical protein
MFWLNLQAMIRPITIQKGKTIPLYSKQAQRGGGGTAVPIFDPGTRRGWMVSSFTAKKKTWYPLYRRLHGPQGQFGGVPTGDRTPDPLAQGSTNYGP